MEYKYTGIILSKKDIGETDRIYTIYTLEKGRISAIARGVRKAKSKLAGHLENFYLVDLVVMKNKGMGNISGSIVENNFLNLHKNLETLSEVFEAIKIFDSLISSEEKDTRLFLLLLEYLSAVDRIALKTNKPKTIVKLLAQGFIFKLLEMLGYKVEIRRCVKCGSGLLKDNNFFSFSLGGIICNDCSKTAKDIIFVSNNFIKIMRIFFQNNINSLSKLNIKQKDADELKKISNDFLKWIM